MSSMRTAMVIPALCLALVCQGKPLHADADLLRTFAVCAGRLSAQMEFQWLMADPAADRTEAQREAVVELLASILPPDRGREVLGWRVNAKAAHAALLSRAAFSPDAEEAGWAARQAEALTAECAGLLLS